MARHSVEYESVKHSAKKIHHLPASIPEELIATFEMPWQTAMEHAERQMAESKESLNQKEQSLSNQSEKHQSVLAKEHELEEESDSGCNSLIKQGQKQKYLKKIDEVKVVQKQSKIMHLIPSFFW